MALSGQSAIKHWLDRGWRAAQDADHSLSDVAGERLGGLTVSVLLGPSNRFGATYFHVLLVDARERVGEPSLALGLYHSGPYPSYNWVEIIRLAQRVTFGPSTKGEGRVLDVREKGLDQELLRRIADVIPPGGHMMIEYDSAEQAETARGLQRDIPPAATPLGYLLYSIGCGVGLRDWYFAEGGSEGPRKLQGCKPLHEAHARQGGQRLARRLLKFLERPLSLSHADLEEPARHRAVKILSGIDVHGSDLQRVVQRILASR